MKGARSLPRVVVDAGDNARALVAALASWDLATAEALVAKLATDVRLARRMGALGVTLVAPSSSDAAAE